MRYIKLYFAHYHVHIRFNSLSDVGTYACQRPSTESQNTRSVVSKVPANHASNMNSQPTTLAHAPADVPSLVTLQRMYHSTASSGSMKTLKGKGTCMARRGGIGDF